MQIKLLNDIIREIAGEQAVQVVEIIFEKRDVNEFLIAKKMKMTINQIRNIFYKLSNFGLVSFTRKKDKKKGWYTYFWTLETYRCLELLLKRLDKEIENLKMQLKNRETKRFYVCKICKGEVGEEAALVHDFVCQECGDVYELSESEKVVALLKSRIDRLERQRNDVSQELEISKQASQKKIKRADKRKDKKKKNLARIKREDNKKKAKLLGNVKKKKTKVHSKKKKRK